MVARGPRHHCRVLPVHFVRRPAGEIPTSGSRRVPVRAVPALDLRGIVAAPSARPITNPQPQTPSLEYLQRPDSGRGVYGNLPRYSSRSSASWLRGSLHRDSGRNSYGNMDCDSARSLGRNRARCSARNRTRSSSRCSRSSGRSSGGNSRTSSPRRSSGYSSGRGFGSNGDSHGGGIGGVGEGIGVKD